MSIDTSNINLLNVIQGRFTKVASTGGGEWHGACPFCGGSDRFIVQPNQNPPKWWCRVCDRKGDAIAFMQQYHNLSFAEAVERLGLESQLNGNKKPGHKPQPPLPAILPRTVSKAETIDSIPALDNPEYIEKSSAFADWSWRNLMSGKYPQISEYLERRGIDQVSQDLFMLGFNPYQMKRTWGGVEVTLVPGITIPYLDGFEGTPRKIKIRRMTDEKKNKYIAVAGGANWLFNAWRIKADSIVVMCEGEIDAISIAIACHHWQVVPVATGSTRGARWLRWPALLSVAHRVLIAFDDDEPGEEAMKWWANYLPKAKGLTPTAHDINDMLTQGQDIRLWIEKGL